MTPQELKPLISKCAAKHKLKPELVYGVVKQESGVEPAAVRFEPAYRYLYKPSEMKPKACSLETEITLQKTSFGLMQCMGGLLRELGLRGWLSAILAEPEMQLDYGCLYLSRQIKKYGELRGISAYNAGSPTSSNADYVQKVIAFAREWPSIECPVPVRPTDPETSPEELASHEESHKRIDALFAALKAIAG